MKAIIFDVDGTLWDTTHVVAKAWNQAIKDCHIPYRGTITSDRLKQEFGKTMSAIAASVFCELPLEQQFPAMEDCVRYEGIFIPKHEGSLLYEGVKETIPQLAKDRRLFIVSNCQGGYIELFMRKNGFEPYITDFESFGNTGRPKGENIRLIIERNDLREAFYVGDTQGDYEACQLAGGPFVFASYGFGQPKGYAAKIDRFSDLLTLSL